MNHVNKTYCYCWCWWCFITEKCNLLCSEESPDLLGNLSEEQCDIKYIHEADVTHAVPVRWLRVWLLSMISILRSNSLCLVGREGWREGGREGAHLLDWWQWCGVEWLLIGMQNVKWVLKLWALVLRPEHTHTRVRNHLDCIFCKEQCQREFFYRHWIRWYLSNAWSQH